MKINPSVWEDDYEDYLDDEGVSFEKLTHKAKTVKRDQKAAIKQKRKEKLRRREEASEQELDVYVENEY